MRQRSRRHVLLQQYELDPRSSLRLAARSEAHEKAHVRMRPSDVEALRRPAGEGSGPIVALFSTRYAQEAVQLRADEALYVRLPAGEAEGRGRAGEAGRAAAPAPGEQAPPRGEAASAPQPPPGASSAPRPPPGASSAARAVWVALRVSAHHAYVTGMRVSGIMHRSIVRLERDKTL
jgi:hypothetical protein